MTSGRRRTPAVAAAALALASASCGGPPDAPTRAPSVETCEMGEVTAHPLVDAAGHLWYLEPQALPEGPDDELLLLGTPAYGWEAQQGEPERLNRTETDLRAGAWMRGDTVRLLPKPGLEGVPTDLRGIHLGGRRWGAFFTMGPKVFDPEPRRPAWFGEIEGGAWRSLDSLPLPEGRALRPSHTSEPVRSGAGIAWAVLLDGPVGRQPLTIYTREGGRWRHEVVAEMPLENFGLVERDGPPLVVGVTPSTSSVFPRDVVVLADEDGWRVRQRVPVAATGGSRQLRSVATALGPYVSWHSAGAVWALRIDPAVAEPPQPVLVDEGVVYEAALAHEGLPFWVTIAPPRNGEDGLGTVRVLTILHGRPVLVGTHPSPFLGPIAARSFRGRVAVVGPQYRHHETHPSVVTLRLDVPLTCR